MLESDEDKSKFEIMYTEYKNLMLYVANQILHDIQDSEDVVHQTFLKVIGILGKIEEPKCHKTRALLVTIVERTAIDLYRKRQNHATVELRDEYICDHFLQAETQIDLAAAIIRRTRREVIFLKQRLTAMVAVLMLVVSCIATAYADASICSTGPSMVLQFSSTTATCRSTLSSTGNSLHITMELWQGTTKVASWNGSGTSFVSVSGTHSVSKGKTYTLKATYTINGTSYTASPVTKTCPR